MNILKQQTFGLALAVATCIVSQPSSARDLTYLVSNNNVPARIAFSPYYLAHNLDEHVFQALKLDLSPAETANALRYIATTLSLTAPNFIVVKNFRAGEDLRISFRLMKPKDQTVLIVGTNYDPGKDAIDNGPPAKQLAVLFYLANDRLIYHRDVYSSDREKQLKDSNNLLGLSDFYVLDDNTDNDSRVLPLLDQIEADPNLSSLEKFIAFLTRGQIALIRQDFQTADKVSAEANNRLAALRGDQRETAIRILGLFSRDSLILKSLMHN